MPGALRAASISPCRLVTPSDGLATSAKGVVAGATTGTRSLCTSTPPPAPGASTWGEITMVLGVNSRVWPSAGDLATALAPIKAPAPGLLSTTTGCPKAGASFSANTRAAMSGPPPGGKGTTRVMVLAGKAWACARPSGRPAAIQALSAHRARWRRCKVIGCAPVGGVDWGLSGGQWHVPGVVAVHPIGVALGFHPLVATRSDVDFGGAFQAGFFVPLQRRGGTGSVGGGP